MGLLRTRAWPWALLVVLLAILGLVVFDGVIGGVALFLMLGALFMAVRRALSDADMSGVIPGGGG